MAPVTWTCRSSGGAPKWSGQHPIQMHTHPSHTYTLEDQAGLMFEYTSRTYKPNLTQPTRLTYFLKEHSFHGADINCFILTAKLQFLNTTKNKKINLNHWSFSLDQIKKKIKIHLRSISESQQRMSLPFGCNFTIFDWEMQLHYGYTVFLATDINTSCTIKFSIFRGVFVNTFYVCVFSLPQIAPW